MVMIWKHMNPMTPKTRRTDMNCYICAKLIIGRHDVLMDLDDYVQVQICESCWLPIFQVRCKELGLPLNTQGDMLPKAAYQLRASDLNKKDDVYVCVGCNEQCTDFYKDEFGNIRCYECAERI